MLQYQYSTSNSSFGQYIIYHFLYLNTSTLVVITIVDRSGQYYWKQGSKEAPNQMIREAILTYLFYYKQDFLVNALLLHYLVGRS